MDQDFLQQKHLIIQTAWGMFGNHGIKATSIEKICTGMKISKKTFYKYFRNKEDLIYKTFVLNRHKITLLIDNAVKKQESPLLILIMILKHLRRMVDSKQFNLENDLFFPISPIIIEEIAVIYPNVWKEIDQFRHQVLLKLSLLLEQEKGEFLKEGIETKVITAMLLATMEHIIHPDFLRKNKIPVDQALDSVITLLFTGMIKTEKQKDILHLLETKLWVSLDL